METTPNRKPYLTFEEWISALDDFVTAKTGTSIHDLADLPYRDYFNDELNLEEAWDSMLCDSDDLQMFQELA